MDKSYVDRYDCYVEKIFTDDFMNMLGINSDTVEVYNYIKTNRKKALDISKELKRPRTNIYRSLEKLMELNLVMKQRSFFAALPLVSILPIIMKQQLILEEAIVELKKISMS
jgi:predicted transcriptional regulator